MNDKKTYKKILLELKEVVLKSLKLLEDDKSSFNDKNEKLFIEFVKINNKLDTLQGLIEKNKKKT